MTRWISDDDSSDDDSMEEESLSAPVGSPQAFKNGLGPPRLPADKPDEDHTPSGLKLSKRRLNSPPSSTAKSVIV